MVGRVAVRHRSARAIARVRRTGAADVPARPPKRISKVSWQLYRHHGPASKVALHKVMALITQSPTVGTHASTPCEARQWLRHPRKTSHICMPTALSAMQSGEATANVVRYGILIMAMLVTAPWRRSTAQQRARAAPRWPPKESPMPCRVSRAPDRARHTPRVPCLPANENSPQLHTSAVGAACAAAACVQAIIHCTPLASGGRPSGSNQRRSFGERR